MTLLLDSQIGDILESRYQILCRLLVKTASEFTPQLHDARVSDALSTLDSHLPDVIQTLERMTPPKDSKRLYMLMSEYFERRGLAKYKLRWGLALLGQEMPMEDGLEMDVVLLNNISLINMIAGAYDELGDYENALHFYTYLISFENSLPNISDIYNNIGVTYRKLERFEEAEQYARRAMAIEREKQQHKKVALSLMNLAEVHYARWEMPESMACMKEALEIIGMTDDLYLQAQFTAQFAVVTVANLMLDEAVPIYEKALHLLDGLGDGVVAARTRYNYALLCHLLKREEDAIQLASLALTILEPYGLPEAQNIRRKLKEWQSR